jgi:ring-1,2-phenylacetyl-CoA epoxidase subunit PaaD
MPQITEQEVWQILQEIKDPEIPVISLVEMGMIRDVRVIQSTIQVTLTPTFVGCPALQVMQEEVQTRLKEAGVDEVMVITSHHPPWSSDWITPEGRARLKEFGLAPTCPSFGPARADLTRARSLPILRFRAYQPEKQLRPHRLPHDLLLQRLPTTFRTIQACLTYPETLISYP